jgi:hypothetical protein
MTGENMLDKFRLNNLPGYAKVFVGLFTALMLVVAGWAAFLVYFEKVVEMDAYYEEAYNEQPWDGDEISNDSDEMIVDEARQEDAGLLAEDSSAVLAPIWDSTFAGREVHVDSVSNLERFRQRDSEMSPGNESPMDDNSDIDLYQEEKEFEGNIKLAHVHLNGQTLLFFAIGLVFLFTTVSSGLKKTLYWIFGPAVLLHLVGLAGQGYGEFYNIALIIAGTAILICIFIMAVLIFLDLARKPDRQDG